MRAWWSTEQVASLLGCAPKTVRRWIYSGKIPARQMSDRAPWKIPGWWVEREMRGLREPIEVPADRARRRIVTIDSAG